MKILVFGAGVLGCNLARNLFCAGKDVTLLARGRWAEEIQKAGLRIKNMFSPCMSVSRVPVVTELKSDDWYDRDMEEFFDNNGAEYPVWRELEKECGKYLE